MKKIIQYVHYDFGLKKLLPEWKLLFNKAFFWEDFFAGITVATIAIPLSLAIALASGVEPAIGLTTAIVGGLIAALMGGTKLAVTGPAAAISVLIAAAVQKHGISGLIVVTMGCGLLQLFSGLFGLGKLGRFVPVPVVTGFTAGIGAIIIIGQLPRALGLPSPDQSHILDVLLHLSALIREAHPISIFLSVLTILLSFGVSKFFPKWPGALIAVAIPTALTLQYNFGVQTIGSIPESLPLPALPAMPTGPYLDLIVTTLIIFAIASLETLLSSSAVDKMMKGQSQHDPDQEMIGQGLSNIAVSLFGGIPVTGVIARSGLNVQSGAKTRRSAMIQAFALLGAVFVFAPLMEKVPIAALAGILITVALRMLHPKEFRSLLKTSRSDAFVYAITFVTIIFVDLLAGIQAGVSVALLILVIRLSQNYHLINFSTGAGPIRLFFGGPITFLSSVRINHLKTYLEKESNQGRGIIIEMSEVSHMDATGSELFIDFVHGLLGKGRKVALRGMTRQPLQLLKASDHTGKISESMVHTESQAYHKMGAAAEHTKERLSHGVRLFKSRLKHNQYENLFSHLSSGQQPHTLFITCCDSRIVPNLITSTEPGELFIARNIGNMVAPYNTDERPSEGAAIEYSLGVLGVKDIVICGHSSCGAIQAILENRIPDHLPSVAQWLAKPIEAITAEKAVYTADQLAKENVLQQLENLKTYPIVQEKIESRSLRIHGWFYNIGLGELSEWSETQKKFIPLGLNPDEARLTHEKPIEPMPVYN